MDKQYQEATKEVKPVSKGAMAYEETLAPVEYEVDGQKIKLTPKIVQDFLVSGGNQVTIQEFKFFVELCKMRKLNPFLKEAYLIKFSNTSPAQIVVGKDAILKRAVKHNMFDGREQGIIIQKEDGTIENRKGTFKMNDETLVGGWATVYRKDWKYPVHVTVSFGEVAQYKGGNVLNNQWETKGATMVEKVALVRALREAFVEDTAGMYDADEVWDEKQPHIIIEQDEPLAAKTDKKEPSLNDI